LITTQAGFKAAEGAETAAYALLRSADSNAKGFIATAIKVLSLAFGNGWSNQWVATGLPDNKVAIPKTQDKRFAALGGLKAFLTDNPTYEVTTDKIVFTAALAETRYQAVSDARQAVANALSKTAGKMIPRDNALLAFRAAYRSTVDEIGECLSPDDPRWYDFGLNRPADGDQPGIPMQVTVSALGGGRVLAQTAGARRASSFNFYKKVTGTDPVKAVNQEGTTYVFEALPVGATVEITIRAVNQAGEGHPSDPASVVVS
jgi:hypothetical protein